MARFSQNPRKNGVGKWQNLHALPLNLKQNPVVVRFSQNPRKNGVGKWQNLHALPLNLKQNPDIYTKEAKSTPTRKSKTMT